MSGFLFVVPPFVGHVNPVIGVADELRRRGHPVAWTGDEGLLGRLLPSDAAIHPCGPAPLPPRPDSLRGFAAMRFLWEEVLVPLAVSMAPGVARAVRSAHPDVLVVDQQAFAGAFVAEREGLPWATAATTSAEFTDPLAGLPAVRGWLAEQVARVRGAVGVPGVTDPRFSPHLVIGFTSGLLAGDVGEPVHLVGPVRGTRSGLVRFPWDWLDPLCPLVFVSLGTVSTGSRFLRGCVEAMRPRPWLQAVVVDRGGELRGDVPANVLVREEVPQVPLLERASLVVCHAGHNTVCESLAQGVPLVVAPIRDDQPIVADQVVAAGAGIRLRFNRATAAHIGDAVDTVLREPSYWAGAERVRESFQRAGGAREAADRLESLLSA
ncbi:glycosyltransferase [Saccharothrix mutabilis subsp. mutabilis]|uniref:Glycosyltransferase n=1 Tax=Saccharothrix mutabilis subsp. mutabilis TaxID=66855 RepID=A0ABP3DJG1_9PSEU